jgi:hypothetical protein
MANFKLEVFKDGISLCIWWDTGVKVRSQDMRFSSRKDREKRRKKERVRTLFQCREVCYSAAEPSLP